MIHILGILSVEWGSNHINLQSVERNHSELMSSSTTGQVPCPVLWFEQVRGCSIGLNHPKLMTNYLYDHNFL